MLTPDPTPTTLPKIESKLKNDELSPPQA
jgi:hypothetical protein